MLAAALISTYACGPDTCLYMFSHWLNIKNFIVHVYIFSLSLSLPRVLSAHRQRANSHSEPAKEGVECCDLKVESVGSIGEGTEGARIYSFQMEPLLTQQQLEATFISTADFLVRLSLSNCHVLYR